MTRHKIRVESNATYNDNVNGDLSHKHNGKHMAKDVDIIRFLHCTYKANTHKKQAAIIKSRISSYQ